MADLLSELLAPMRLRGVFHSSWSLRAPWGVVGEREDCAILHYVQRGSCVVELAPGDPLCVMAGDDCGPRHGEPVRLGAGDLAIFPHGVSHRLADRAGQVTVPLAQVLPDREPGAVRALRIDGPGEATELLCGGLHYEPLAAAPLYRALPELIVLEREVVERQPLLAGTLEQLGEQWAEDRPGAALVALRAFELIFILALRAALEERDVPVLRALRHPAIGRALLAVHTRFAEPWTLESMAAEAGMSRSAFASGFRELVGEPPMQHLTARRMQEAARLLVETGLSHGRIAERVGYGSDVGFHLAFRAWSGGTPGQYRRSALIGK
ncbi:MAG: AraC family transcriptional regulator [Thermoactinospora sp.]|nr:AraC family transcriptional regulator [Thermoactinospora sp.]